MKIALIVCISLFIMSSCSNTAQNASARYDDNIDIANKFVNAFYSFDRDSLASVLSMAGSSQPNILYYQKWAECGHYEIVNRSNYFKKNDSLVIFPVTVKDDLMSALHIDFNVTDTFRIAIRDGKIRSIENSSNDPDEYYQAKEWVKMNRPEFIEKACEGIWNGGPTPCECIQGMIKGFDVFVAQEKQTN